MKLTEEQRQQVFVIVLCLDGLVCCVLTAALFNYFGWTL